MNFLSVYIIGIKWSSDHLALSTAGTGCNSYYAHFSFCNHKSRVANVRCILCLLGLLQRFKLSNLAPTV